MKAEQSDLAASVDRHVTLRGVAEDAKAGAVLVTDADETIYLHGKRSWEDELLGRRVAVDGTLRLGRIYPGVTTAEGASQQGIRDEHWYLEVENYRRAR